MFLDALTKVTPYKDEDDKLVNVFVETPKGSRQKYDLDHGIGLMTWSLELSAGLNFPLSFGCVPNKKAEDGDALDIILLLDAGIPPDTVLPARLVGMMQAKQNEANDDEAENWVRNDRVTAVASLSRSYADIHGLDDLRDELKWDIQEFFGTYNRMIERGFESLGFKGAGTAYQLLDESIANAK